MKKQNFIITVVLLFVVNFTAFGSYLIDIETFKQLPIEKQVALLKLYQRIIEESEAQNEKMQDKTSFKDDVLNFFNEKFGMPEATARSNKYDGFYGGWPTKSIWGKLDRPHRRNSIYKETYLKRCEGSNRLYCNPAIFGDGHCISIAPRDRQYAFRNCFIKFQESGMSYEQLVSRLLENPSLLKILEETIQTVGDKCKNSRRQKYICDKLKLMISGMRNYSNILIERGVYILGNANEGGVDGKIDPPVICDDDDIVPNGVISYDLYKNFKSLGGDTVALDQALCFLDKNKGKKFNAKGAPGYGREGIGVDNDRYMIIQDFNKSRFEQRMFFLDLKTGEVKSYLSVDSEKGSRAWPRGGSSAFSNRNGSNKTPRGFLITGNLYKGWQNKRWYPGLRLHGIQKGVNDNTYNRGIVFHQGLNSNATSYVGAKSSSSDEINPDLLPAQSPPGQCCTKGCAAVAPKQWCGMLDMIYTNYTRRSLNKKDCGYGRQKEKNIRPPFKGGSLMYNYTAVEKGFGREYCGDNVSYKR